ncbi:MAG: ribbon-helix-helix domain-containing protein [Acidimicrobiales bacterium]
MKTAISVPDGTYERASKRAADLGMSRSELFSRAVVHYLDELDDSALTVQIDEAVASVPELDGSTADAVGIGHRLLDELHDEW